MVARALTIAGSDSGGGAGIQADLKTFFAFGVHGTSAITALTAQNTRGVTGIHEVPAAFVAEQIDAVAGDIGVDAAKTGMLSSAPIVAAVADACARHQIERLVVDPVFVTKHGVTILRDDAVETLRRSLIPRALVITPNRPEAEGLLGRDVPPDEPMDRTAEELLELGSSWVLLKGGHYEGGLATDVLVGPDGRHTFESERLDTPHTHGTGCTLAAAITAGLAKGSAVPEAVDSAKGFVHRAIERSLRIGGGIGPVNQGHAIWRDA